ncbi:MAG: methyltransferase domain-containing protein [Acidimicrobiia bacterium]
MLPVANCYDYPQYYDLAFRLETRAEVEFIEAACRKYCPFPARRMLEPGCGGGRLVVALAGRGYDMVGFDLNQPSVEYLMRRMKRRKLRAEVFRADMAEFRLTQPVDAAFSAWDTFRHLTSERAARRHLECVAASLQQGGIYLLGFHLLPLRASDQRLEHWSARHGSTRLTVTLQVVATDRRRRIEEISILMQVRTRSGDLRLRTQFPFRMYTAGQFRKLLASVPQFELCDVYDFLYEINHPLQLNDEITDTVFVLRRR